MSGDNTKSKDAHKYEQMLELPDPEKVRYGIKKLIELVRKTPFADNSLLEKAKRHRNCKRNGELATYLCRKLKTAASDLEYVPTSIPKSTPVDNKTRKESPEKEKECPQPELPLEANVEVNEEIDDQKCDQDLEIDFEAQREGDLEEKESGTPVQEYDPEDYCIKKSGQSSKIPIPTFSSGSNSESEVSKMERDITPEKKVAKNSEKSEIKKESKKDKPKTESKTESKSKSKTENKIEKPKHTEKSAKSETSVKCDKTAESKSKPEPKKRVICDADVFNDPFTSALAEAESSVKPKKNKKKRKHDDKEMDRDLKTPSMDLDDSLGTLPKLPKIEAPKLDWGSVLDTPEVNYKHVPQRNLPGPSSSASAKAKAQQCNDTSYLAEALSMRKFQSGKQTVYSGKRKGVLHQSGEVPSLKELSLAVIGTNLDELEDTGDIPFDILSSALEKATPTQLYTIEQKNPTLWVDGDSEDLWSKHVKRDFPKADEPDESELWRDFYQRLLREREQKFERLKHKLVSKVHEPVETVRTAKLSEPVAPAHIRRKQQKYGTNVVRTSSKSASNAAEISRLRRQMEQRNASPGTSDGSRADEKPAAIKALLLATRQSESVSRAQKKPMSHRAPMMQKSMRMFKMTKINHR